MTVRTKKTRSAKKAVRKSTTVRKKSSGRVRGTSKGKKITDRDIRRLAKEAEKGYDEQKLRPRPGRPSMGSAPADVMPIRIDPELRRALKKVAKKESKSTSEVIREAIRQYVA